MTASTAGRIASAPQAATCPKWCVVDHGDDPSGDVFHRSAFAQVGPPRELVHIFDEDVRLTAHLVLPEEPQPGDMPAIVVDHGEVFGSYAELDVADADQFIRDLKAFTARIQQMRDQLAAAKGKQS